jgi:hypothetical protein
LGVFFLGYGILFGALIPIIALGSLSIEMGLFILLVFVVAWNFLTFALLPVMVMDRAPFGEALGEGFRLSWELKARWAPQLIAQLVILGIFVIVHVEYTDVSPGGWHRQKTTNYNVHGFWAGGYLDAEHWHEDYMSAVKSEPVPFVSAALTLLFIVMAVCIKIHAIRALWDELKPEPEPPPEPDEFVAQLQQGLDEPPSILLGEGEDGVPGVRKDPRSEDSESGDWGGVPL